jgi:type IV secretion system protein TrbL
VGNLNVIDRFTETFSNYIDSGFGMFSGEVGFLTATLIGIDVVLAGLMWSLAGEGNVLAAFLKKVLFVGGFAFILNNFSMLANIIFASFAGIGLKATGGTLTAADLMHPGFVAGAGFTAAHPLYVAASELGFFDNTVTIIALFLAWLVVVVAFFLLAVQLFITILEFKLTTLAGFVLVPFALWGKTAFLAERVLGNVVTSGVKLMVLAVVLGIGSTIFGSMTSGFGSGEVTLEQAASLILASLALLGLGIFGPAIANGLVSGAPQLGAGAAVGTAAAAVAGGALGAGAAGAGLRAGGSGLSGAVRAGSSLAGMGSAGYAMGRAASGASGARSLAAGAAGAARATAGALASGVRSAAGRALGAPKESFEGGARAAIAATGGRTTGGSPGSPSAGGGGGAPDWARRLREGQQLREAGMVAAHAVGGGDRAGASEGPRLREEA